MTAVRMLTVAVGVLALCSFAGTAPGAGTRSLPAIHVSGKRLLNSGGHAVQLHGVNRSGSGYACVQGWGIFDGPSDAASVEAIAGWHVNAVRIPINEGAGSESTASSAPTAARTTGTPSCVRRAPPPLRHVRRALAHVGRARARQGNYQPAARMPTTRPRSGASWRQAYRNDPRDPRSMGRADRGRELLPQGRLPGHVLGEHRPHRIAGMQQAVTSCEGRLPGVISSRVSATRTTSPSGSRTGPRPSAPTGRGGAHLRQEHVQRRSVLRPDDPPVARSVP